MAGLPAPGSLQRPAPVPSPRGLPPALQDGSRPDLLATSGDFLRLWRISEEPGAPHQGVRLEKLLNNVRRHCACAACAALVTALVTVAHRV